MEPNTMEPPNGSSRAAHLRSGTQQDHCYGSMESVCPFRIRSSAFFDASRPYGLVAGSGKTILWYVSPQVYGLQRVHVTN